MTARTPTYLKSLFENNDIPQQADYEDIFDSFLPVTSSGKQTLDIALEITGDLTAANVYASAGNFNQINIQNVSASVGTFDRVNANFVSASGGNFNVINVQNISASAALISYLREPVVSSVAARGTVTASAAVVSAGISVINAVTTASEECVIIKRSRPGFTQTIINGTSSSAKAFPTSAAKFNSQSNGASIDIPQNRTLTVYHITSAQYYTATHTR